MFPACLAAPVPPRRAAAVVARGIVLALFVLPGLACGGGGSDASTAPPLSITPPEATVSVGASTQFSAINARGTVTWTSSDESVVGVVSTGFATAKAPGRATLTATDSRGSATATVTVPRPAALALSATSLTFTVQRGDPDPAAQTVQITDAGDDKVSAIAVAGITMPPGQPTGWLTATVAGTTAPTQLTVQAVTAGLAPGVYSATVGVTAARAVNAPQSVVVTLTVTAPPAITLSKSTASFAMLQGSANPAPEVIDVTNGGGGSIAGLTATVAYGAGQPTGWLTAGLSATTAPATLTLQPDASALGVGHYTATVTVSAPGASNGPQSVAVTFDVSSGPAIGLSAATATFAATVGGASPAEQTIAVTNAGGGALTGLAAAVTYGAGEPTGWLAATLSSATAPATLTLRPTLGGLAAGTYTATVAIASPAATSGPRTVTVTFTVADPSRLQIGSATLSVSATRGGNAQTVGLPVTHQGGSPLTGLTTTVVYPAGQPAGWLNATLSATTTPTLLVLQASAAGLTPGQYTATVNVAAPGASNGPQSVAVTFTVLWSLSQDVYPAIASYCTGCHFAGAPTDLSSATAFYDNLVGAPTTTRNGYPLAATHSTRVVPFNPGASYLLDQLSGSPGAFAMPPGGGVPSSVISIVAAWISQGAPKN